MICLLGVQIALQYNKELLLTTTDKGIVSIVIAAHQSHSSVNSYYSATDEEVVSTVIAAFYMREVDSPGVKLRVGGRKHFSHYFYISVALRSMLIGGRYFYFRFYFSAHIFMLQFREHSWWTGQDIFAFQVRLHEGVTYSWCFQNVSIMSCSFEL